MSEIPAYVSKSTIKSFWQEYRIYDDHLELDTLFGRMRIPFSEVDQAEVADSEVRGLLKGDLHLRYTPALKLDWANFLEHVVIDKTTGLIRHVLVTPDDPSAFVKALNDSLARYRQKCDAEV